MHNPHTKRPIIWSIAGSDCSGGAGIQADIKTGQALHCEVCTLITANTVQNSEQVLSINPVDTSVLQQQWQALIKHKLPVAIKIGLIANNEQLQWLVTQLTEFKSQHANIPVVMDPVIKASVGQDLNAEVLDSTLLKQLFFWVDVLTPNTEEAALLCDDASQNRPPSVWAQTLLNTGIRQVILTGGHRHDSELVIDECYSNTDTLVLQSPRVQTSGGHGSGCSFSTALASFLAHGYLLRDAFMQSKAFLNAAFSPLQGLQGDYAAVIQPCWPVENCFYPQVIRNTYLAKPETLEFAELGQSKLGVYPVVDSIEWLERLLPLGVEIIQLRLKNHSEEELHQLIPQAVELGKQHNSRVFINDYWKLAIEYDAYGVHLGQEDIQHADLQAIAKAGLRLGLSTHGTYEFKLAAQLKPSYLAIGAIFATRTKDMTGQIQGINNLKHMLELAPNCPIVAIGGLTTDNLPDVIATGVNSVAVVTAITEAEKPEQAYLELNDLFEKHQIQST